MAEVLRDANYDFRHELAPRTTGITFTRYEPDRKLNPLDLMPAYGMIFDEGTASKEFHRRFGPQVLYEDEKHERGQRALDLGVEAVRKSGQTPDVIVVCTSHLPEPDEETNGENQRIANRLRKKLVDEGLIQEIEPTPENTRTISAACTGFVAAIDELAKINPQGKNVLIVVDETNYRETMPEPKDDEGKSGLLFSDVAQAIQIDKWGINIKVLASKVNHFGDPNNFLGMNVALYDREDPFLTVYDVPRTEKFRMKGPNLITFFDQKISDEEIEDMLVKANTQRSQLDFFLSHQASIRMVSHFNRKFPDVMMKVDIDNLIQPEGITRYGNTSSASIPLLLDDFMSDGRISKNQRGLLLAYGAGLAWGGAVIEIAA